MIPNKRRDAPPSKGFEGGDKPRETEKLPGDVEPEKKEDDMTEEQEGGLERDIDDRDELA